MSPGKIPVLQELNNGKYRSKSGAYNYYRNDSDTSRAYLLDINYNIISDCRIANEIDMPERNNSFSKTHQFPPPAKEEYYERNVVLNINDDDFIINWYEEKREVIINIDGADYIKFNYSNKKGF